MAANAGLEVTQTVKGMVGCEFQVFAEFSDLQCSTCFTNNGADGADGTPGTPGANGYVATIVQGSNIIVLGSGTTQCPTNGYNGNPGSAGGNAGQRGFVTSNIPNS